MTSQGVKTQATRPAVPLQMFSRYREGLDAELHSSIPPVDSELYLMHRYFQGWTDTTGVPSTDSGSQGKRVRPTLCLFTCDALGGDWARALPATAALELIHSFSMIHDDIQDGDKERHHRSTVWYVWGQPKALVAGDSMNTLADLMAFRLTNNGFVSDKVVEASSLLSESCLEMIEGQCLDISFESRLDITTGEYLDMIGRKAGALIRCAMELGAILAVDDEKTIQAFRHCGSLLGRAFQIRDDVLGIWGNEAVTGKPAGNDIRRKKKSFPVIYALEHSKDETRKTLVQTYGKDHLAEEDVARVLDVLEEAHTLEAASTLISQTTAEALTALAGIDIPSWARHELEELVAFLGSREF